MRFRRPSTATLAVISEQFGRPRDQRAAARKAWDKRGRKYTEGGSDNLDAMEAPGGGAGDVRPGALTGLNQPDAGFTRDSQSFRPLRSGFAVAVGGSDRLIASDEAFDPTTGKVDPKLVSMVQDRITAARGFAGPTGTRVAVGAWTNPADMKTEFNVTVVFPRTQRSRAMKYAQANDQIAMFSLHDFEVIDTGGSGGVRAVE